MIILKRGTNKRRAIILFITVFSFFVFFYSIFPVSSNFYQIKQNLISLTGLYQSVCDGALRYENNTRVLLEKIRNVTKCKDNPAYPRFKRKGDYLVMYNYVVSKRRFKCEESVTYVTHSDYTFLANLALILEKWRGPVSIALHAPGTDFQPTLDSIAYLRSCTPLVEEFVNFHLYFEEAHVPAKVSSYVNESQLSYNCSLPPPFNDLNRKKMYVKRKKLLYPINVGRNIARTMSETHYVFSSDIELYPSPNFIPQFLELIVSCSNRISAASSAPAVFAFNVFEIESNQTIPNTKTELLDLLNKGLAVPFHQQICPECHSVPGFSYWKEDRNGKDGVSIFKVSKRIGKYYHWEPFYVGTNEEPLFDERLSWEGESDKIVQAYTMCLMNYSFLIMDGAFLVHSPGIKRIDPKKRKLRMKYVNETNALLNQVIIPELRKIYGKSYNCDL